jgi:hypothetical protein
MEYVQERSMPVVFSTLSLFGKPLLSTQFGMASREITRTETYAIMLLVKHSILKFELV